MEGEAGVEVVAVGVDHPGGVDLTELDLDGLHLASVVLLFVAFV